MLQAPQLGGGLLPERVRGGGEIEVLLFKVLDQAVIPCVPETNPTSPGLLQSGRVDPGRLRSTTQNLRRLGQQGLGVTARLCKHPLSLVRRGRLGAQALRFGLRTRPPLAGQLTGAADRAWLISMCGVHLQCAVEQIGDLPGAAGIGLFGVPHRPCCRPQLFHRHLHLIRARHREGGESAQQGDHALTFRFERSLQNQLHGVEIPCGRLGFPDGLGAGPRPFIVEFLDLGEPLSPCVLRCTNLLAAVESPLTQPLARVHQCVETQRRGHHVVQLGRPVVRDRPQFVVRQKGTIGGDRLVPSQGRAGVVSLDAIHLVGPGIQIHTLHPYASCGKRLWPLFDRKGRRDLRRPGPVQVAPPLLPDRRPALPALVLARQQQLQGFGEARFAAAVAPHNQREAGAGGDLQVATGADTAKTLDRDLVEVRTFRRSLNGIRLRGGPCFRSSSILRQGPIQRRVPVECPEDQQPGLDIELFVRIHPCADLSGQCGASMHGRGSLSPIEGK